MGDVLRDKDASVVAVLASAAADKVTFLAVCAPQVRTRPAIRIEKIFLIGSLFVFFEGHAVFQSPWPVFFVM
jgi:hypothetical protein